MWEPFGTQPANATAYWKPAPSERGTFGILSTCILTLLLCVYTSLHLNIPVHKVTHWSQKPWVLKTFGVLVGLCAPELVAFLAFRQWNQARNLKDFMSGPIAKLIPPTIATPRRHMWSRYNAPADVEQATELTTIDDKSDTIEAGRKKNTWTRTHSHFALMGGFAFEADDSFVNLFPDSNTRMTLLPRALRKMADVEPMSIPDLSKSAIEDKSKANWLAKALVCSQACWFIVQITGRASTSAPISLLEMNTFLHALCCLIIYLAWWYKPLDILEPELIRMNTEPTRKMCAWMIMNSRLGAHRLLKNESTIANRGGLLVHTKDLYNKDGVKPACAYFAHYRFPKPEDVSNDLLQRTVEADDGPAASLKLYIGQSIHGHYLVLAENYYSILGEYHLYDREKNQDGLNDLYLALDPVTLECLRLVDVLRTESGANDIWKTNWDHDNPDTATLLVPYISNFDTRSVELSGFRGSNIFTKKVEVYYFFPIMLLVAGSVYGLVHLIAWNGPFTTPIQRWMWRVSCLIIASPTVIVAFGFLALKLFDAVEYENWAYVVFAPLWLLGKAFKAIFPEDSTQWNIAIFVLLGVLGLTYLAARVYLLVECFINISQLPPEVYQVPQWSQYIPHLGAG
ncbi:hypothetical protein C7974DRAFT_342103 [Boeremia exigua]|uniref:uncharacterized protein n=1 Tax=Boeremia exigua TaxID=749465 RepID=UPI001E8D4504|nr:uncharacterized protein C7974DRAFT_342103 [Boeremia exigua]KAH6619005.1 hypothetical protein C7974DRAFT_342103 [Boeremia exigua]